ncbi:uncharacterized protein LOC129559360 isoform X1 [Moschus berezovskii]|uniref:uncharacterized protein LOC129559360 isoform X1 n=1 Tax=Moschus berezovskii TaxID=68408 RepID=UPI002444F149|nr:uncharacterized protein LOC129559360 isoform X1 [Moschus berezovskii]
MADDKDSLPKLKDLAFLKNQLERLQQRVEDEVNSGVGQVKKGLPILDISFKWTHMCSFGDWLVASVRQVYAPRFFCLNKNLKRWKLETSACHSSRTDHVTALRQISVTAPCDSSILFRK